jgi:molybdopterin-guanine dinucleotide biosynthesis protein MobB
VPPALPVVRVQSDRRNAGKTWLASALIEDFTRRGYVVGAVKRSHHALPPDKEGSDTDLFARAGAERVLFAASDGVLDRAARPASLGAALDRLRGEVDIAVVEGFKADQLGARIAIDADAGIATLTSMDGRELAAFARCDAKAFADAIEREFELTSAGDSELRRLIRSAAAAHGHACPGVTLGVRMALAATQALGVAAPQHRGLDVTVETARCAVDAIAASTGCSLGRGNLHLDERGRLAARFLDRNTGREVRVAAREESKALAALWAPAGLTRRHAQAIAYRLMPDDLLFELAVHSPACDEAPALSH